MSKGKFLKSKVFRHVVFWAVIFVYYFSSTWQLKKDYVMVSMVSVFEVTLQMLIAYFIIQILIPKLFQKDNKFLFYLSVVGLVVLAHIGFSWYLNYFVFTGPQHDSYAQFLSRSTYFFGYFTTFVSYLTPTMLLLVFNYLERQKEMASLLEQKKSSELDALKNQLNPHFLFNTLNNLYALALKKSDKAPEVIAKLSEILDYILYGCNSTFVPIQNEISLLKNYIALEQVRYGDRVCIAFHEQILNEAKIAPLLLLTFLENAFKHGVSQELGTATIVMEVEEKERSIRFYLKNTKPTHSKSGAKKKREGIGLKNIRKQLDLLYPNLYNLELIDTKESHVVDLQIFI